MPRISDLKEAAQLVPDGATLALGGMTLYRRPVAFVRALLRREPPPKDLTLLAFTAGFESDVLVGAGCVKAVRTCYFGLEAFGLAPAFTMFAGQGVVRVIEETEASLVAGLRAQLNGVGFMPSRAWQGTDLLRLRPDVRQVADPYTGEMLTAFPAIPVDVTVLHALAADQQGNVLLNNNLGVDLELAYAADQVIVTVERFVDRLGKSPDGVILPAPGADIIVLAEHGAVPTACHPAYTLDADALLGYVEACNAGEFAVFLAQFLAEG